MKIFPFLAHITGQTLDLLFFIWQKDNDKSSEDEEQLTLDEKNIRQLFKKMQGAIL